MTRKVHFAGTRVLVLLLTRATREIALSISRKILVSMGLLVITALIGCSKPPAPVPISAEDMNRKNPTELNAGTILSGKGLYHSADCAICHGKDGDGKGFDAKEVRMNLHDWRDAAYTKTFTDGQMYTIIVKGKGLMPAYEARNTPEQIWLMVDYIRSVSSN
jgi:hypothetical protein